MNEPGSMLPICVRQRPRCCGHAVRGPMSCKPRSGILPNCTRRPWQGFWPTTALDAGTIDVVGFHGHTVLHAPEQRLTVQIGDGALLAKSTGIDVVYDLRAADVAAGGQGAPLAPVYHRALTARLPERPIAVLNIGGVANVTWIGHDGELLAFDTGPGNALIDDWMLRHQGVPRDEGGALAAAGRVHDDYVTEYLRHSYFGEPPPKSLDRNAFALELVDQLPAADGAATLTAFTAASIARAREHFPEQPQLWVVSGGGRLNRTLMAMLAGHVECGGRAGRSRGHGRRRGGGRSLGLSRRALARRSAHQFSRHHRRAAASDRRRAGQGVTTCRRSPVIPA